MPDTKELYIADDLGQDAAKFQLQDHTVDVKDLDIETHRIGGSVQDPEKIRVVGSRAQRKEAT